MIHTLPTLLKPSSLTARMILAAIACGIALPILGVAQLFSYVMSVELGIDPPLAFDLYSVLLTYAVNSPSYSLPQSLIEAIAPLIFAFATSYLLNWAGFLLLLPIHAIQRRFACAGFVPTLIIGTALGGLAVLPLALGPFGLTREAYVLFSGAPFIYFAIIGAAHAAVFWLILQWLTQKIAP